LHLLWQMCGGQANPLRTRLYRHMPSLQRDGIHEGGEMNQQTYWVIKQLNQKIATLQAERDQMIRAYMAEAQKSHQEVQQEYLEWKGKQP